MLKPILIKKVSGVLAAVLLFSMLMPILASAAILANYAQFDGKEVSGTVYSDTYNSSGITLQVYGGPDLETPLDTVSATYEGYDVTSATYMYNIIPKKVSQTIRSKVGLKESSGDTVTEVVYSGFVNEVTDIITDIPTTLTVNDEHKAKVTASYLEGDPIDVTSEAIYASTKESVATVDAGLVKALDAGETVISVTYGGITKEVTVTVVGGNPPVDKKPVWADVYLTASNVDKYSLTLNWPKATAYDNSTVTYHVYKDAALLSNSVTGVTYYNVTGLNSSTSYSFKVVAVDASGNKSSELSTTATTRGAGSTSGGGGGGGGGGGSTNTTNSDGSINVTNGQVDATTLKNAFVGKTNVTLVVKGETVTLPVSALVDAAKKDGTSVTIKADNGTYVLPLSIFNFDALAKELGVAVSDLKITISIKKLSGDAAKSVTDAVAAAGGKALADAVDFSITVEGKDGKKVTINSFGEYVKRTIALHTKPAKNATVALYNPDTKTLSFVPASISDKEAEFYRTGNSVYTVVEFSKSFSDIASHWAKNDIELLASKLIVDGVTDTSFQAERNITRAEFAALVVRSLGLTPASSAAKFSDVKSADWYAGVVGAAVQAGIVNGYEDGTFRPQAQITREELAAMVVRAYEFADGKVAADQASITRALSKYSDAGNIVWGQKEVAIALSAGLMNGMTDTTLETNGQATRAQSATMLKRFLSKVGFID